MIASKSDYKAYLAADKAALDVKGSVADYLFNDIWGFQRSLRLLEYRKNCYKSYPLKLLYFWSQLRVRSLGRRLGFSIPANVFGPGLSIAHAGTVVVNKNSKIGANCRIHVCVNIGADIRDGRRAPVIGDDCYIGPGAKLFGGITLGDNVAIGANSVVNKSFDSNVTIVGAPARVIATMGPRQIRRVDE